MAVIVVLALFPIVFTLALIPPDVAESVNTVEAVSKQGYSDVHIQHIHPFFASFFGCSNGDAAAYKMSATNALGRKVNLIACAGWPFKGVTVRTE